MNETFELILCQMLSSQGKNAPSNPYPHYKFVRLATSRFLARLTLGQPAVCPRSIWTLTRAKSLCLCAFFLPIWPSPTLCKANSETQTRQLVCPGLSGHIFPAITKQKGCRSCRGRKKGSLRKGFFTGGISRISKISRFSKISRKWSGSPYFPESAGSLNLKSLESLSSLESLENGLFWWKDPFSKRPLFPNPIMCIFLNKSLRTYGQEGLDPLASLGLSRNLHNSCPPGHQNLVNLFLTNLVRISGLSSLFSAGAVFLALSGKMCWKYCDRWEKRGEPRNPH